MKKKSERRWHFYCLGWSKTLLTVILVTAATEKVTDSQSRGREAVFKRLRVMERERERERERSRCWWAAAAPPRARLSQSSITPSTGVATATSAFPLTPCEQSRRISPERKLKCQHSSRRCHVGLRERNCVCVCVCVCVCSLLSRVIVQVCRRRVSTTAHCGSGAGDYVEAGMNWKCFVFFNAILENVWPRLQWTQKH